MDLIKICSTNNLGLILFRKCVVNAVSFFSGNCSIHFFVFWWVTYCPSIGGTLIQVFPPIDSPI